MKMWPNKVFKKCQKKNKRLLDVKLSNPYKYVNNCIAVLPPPGLSCLTRSPLTPNTT